MREWRIIKGVYKDQVFMISCAFLGKMMIKGTHILWGSAMDQAFMLRLLSLIQLIFEIILWSNYYCHFVYEKLKVKEIKFWDRWVAEPGFDTRLDSKTLVLFKNYNYALLSNSKWALILMKLSMYIFNLTHLCKGGKNIELTNLRENFLGQWFA